MNRTLNTIYTQTAQVVLAIVLVFLALNALIMVAVLLIRPAPAGSLIYGDTLLDSVYPGWTTEGRTAMLAETWNRPVECRTGTNFGEAAYAGDYVNVTAHGYRCNGECAPWPPELVAFNVFVFGGSTTFGYGVADWETIPANIEDQLRARFSDQPVYIYNFGAGSFYGPQEFIALTQLLMAGHVPDMVIFIDGVNEFTNDVNLTLRGVCGAVEERGLQWPIVALIDALTSQAQDPLPLMTDGVTADNVLARWESMRRMVNGMAAAMGFDTLYVWQPIPGYGYSLDDYLSAGGTLLTAPTSREAYAQIEAGLYTDLADVLFLGNMHRGRSEGLYVDPAHYTGTFSAEIAAQIVARIVEDQSD